MGREYRGRRDEGKKERKKQFGVNVFGSKSQPNGLESAMVKVLRDPLL